MLLPFLIDDPHENIALEVGEGLRLGQGALEPVMLHGLLFNQLLYFLRFLAYQGIHREINQENAAQFVAQGVVVDHPIFHNGLITQQITGHILHHLFDLRQHIIAQEGVVAPVVDDLPLVVHHVVVFQQVLADAEVAGLHPFLGPLDRFGDQLMGQYLPFLHPHAVHEFDDPLAAEQAHQIIFQAEEEHGAALVTLPAGTTPQLQIDAAALVAFGAQDVQAAQLLDPFAQFNVGAPAGHIGGDGHRPAVARPQDDLSLTLVLLGVQYIVGDAPALEHA